MARQTSFTVVVTSFMYATIIKLRVGTRDGFDPTWREVVSSL